MIQNTFPHPIPPRCVGETLGEIHLFQLRGERTHIPLSLEGEGGFKDRSHPQISGYIKMYWCHWISEENLPDYSARGLLVNRRPETHTYLQEHGVRKTLLSET